MLSLQKILPILFFWSLSALLPLQSEAQTDDGSNKKAVFIPLWVPQAQFAGFYVAYEKGIYKKYDIDLEIISGGPERQPAEYLKNHQADFTLLWLSSGIQMMAEGIKVLNVGQLVQQSALMLVAKKASGIRTPQDIDGKKVGLWGPIFQIQPKAFFNKYNLKVKIVRQSSSMDLFLKGGVDVASAMWYNEYHTLLNFGLNPDELTTFFFQDYGLNFPEDGIYVLEDTFNKDPLLCKKFVSASIEGWRYAFAHTEETLDIVMQVMKENHIAATRVHQKWMLKRMGDLILPGNTDTSVPVGTLLSEDYYRVVEVLKDSGFINSTPDYNSFFRSCVLDDQK